LGCGDDDAVRSSRLVFRDLLDLRGQRIFRGFKIETRLTIHPERSAGLEELAKPQCRVGRHRLFFARDTFDPRARRIQRGGDA
jgi:hypothetical protein